MNIGCWGCRFVQFVNIPQITECQLEEMDVTIGMSINNAFLRSTRKGLGKFSQILSTLEYSVNLIVFEKSEKVQSLKSLFSIFFIVIWLNMLNWLLLIYFTLKNSLRPFSENLYFKKWYFFHLDILISNCMFICQPRV